MFFKEFTTQALFLKSITANPIISDNSLFYANGSNIEVLQKLKLSNFVFFLVNYKNLTFGARICLLQSNIYNFFKGGLNK